MLDLVAANLLSPMVLAFILGAIATVIKSDLKLPEGLYTALTIYLLFAIGLKGGVALSQTSLAQIGGPLLATSALAVITPILAFLAAKGMGKLNTNDAASLAAHYGSVSAVTFIAANSFVLTQSKPAEGFLPALVALLEAPAILMAIGLARRKAGAKSLGPVFHELLTNKTTVLLLGGLFIGWIAGKDRMEQVQPLFGDLFRGVLTIFMLEMGLVAAQRFDDLKSRLGFLLTYGTVVPLVHGVLGVALGTLAGLSPGGAAVFGAMAASASYIAAPAAVRVALPEANPLIYLTASIAVTLPFNLAIGIPLYLQFAVWFADHL